MRYKWLLITGFLLIIVGPITLLLIGMRPTLIENRPAASLPTLSPSSVADVDTYEDLGDYVLDRLPGRDVAVELDAAIDYRLLGESPSDDVVVGSDGWLFLAASIDRDCISGEQARDLVTEIERAHLIVAATGRELIFGIAPDKAAIYPDRLGSESARAACAASTRDLIRSELERVPGVAVTAWGDLSTAAEDELVYHRHDTHWNSRGAARFAALLIESSEPGLSSDSTVRQTDTASYEGDLTRLLGIPWSEAAPVVETEREGLADAETSVIELRHEHTAARSIRPPSVASLVAAPTLLLHDSFGLGLRKHLTPFYADFTSLTETHIDYEYVRPLLADADTILLEKIERGTPGFILGERLSSKMVSAFLEELDPFEAGVTISETSIEIESPPPAGANQSVYLVVVADRTLGAISEVWNSATGPDEIRRLGGFRRRVAWRMPPEAGPIELRDFPSDIGIEAFYVTVDAPPTVQE